MYGENKTNEKVKRRRPLKQSLSRSKVINFSSKFWFCSDSSMEGSYYSNMIDRMGRLVNE